MKEIMLLVYSEKRIRNIFGLSDMTGRLNKKQLITILGVRVELVHPLEILEDTLLVSW